MAADAAAAAAAAKRQSTIVPGIREILDRASAEVATLEGAGATVGGAYERRKRAEAEANAAAIVAASSRAGNNVNPEKRDGGMRGNLPTVSRAPQRASNTYGPGGLTVNVGEGGPGERAQRGIPSPSPSYYHAPARGVAFVFGGSAALLAKTDPTIGQLIKPSLRPGSTTPPPLTPPGSTPVPCAPYPAPPWANGAASGSGRSGLTWSDSVASSALGAASGSMWAAGNALGRPGPGVASGNFAMPYPFGRGSAMSVVDMLRMRKEKEIAAKAAAAAAEAAREVAAAAAAARAVEAARAEARAAAFRVSRMFLEKVGGWVGSVRERVASKAAPGKGGWVGAACVCVPGEGWLLCLFACRVARGRVSGLVHVPGKD